MVHVGWTVGNQALKRGEGERAVSVRCCQISGNSRWFQTYDQVAQQTCDRHLADGGDVDGCLLLDSRAVKVAVRREVDANGAVADQLRGHLIAFDGNTGDDDVADGQHLLQAPLLLVLNLMPVVLDPLAARVQLHAGDIHRVHVRAVVGQERRERAADDLGAVDEGDGLSIQPVALREDGVVDVQVLEDLEDGKRRAGQDRLLQIGRRVEVAHVVVHVGQVPEAEALDVLLQRDRLLDVVVLGDVLGPYWVVDEDPVYLAVFVGQADLLLQGLFIDSSQVEGEATVVCNFESAALGERRPSLAATGKMAPQMILLTSLRKSFATIPRTSRQLGHRWL